ncbi:MAG: restriction endonuclease [Chloroflexi bacterium]|nr:restriction endonuclease [Chloroflexota bacterium]
MNTVPTRDELFDPVVQALRQLGGSGRNSEIADKVISLLGMTDRAAQQMSKDGSKTELEDRLGWARTYLKTYGAIDNPRPGTWELTEKGKITREVDPEEVIASYKGRKNPDDHLSEHWRSELLGGQDMTKVPRSSDMYNAVLAALRRRGGSARINEITQEVIEILGIPDHVAEIPHQNGGQTELEYNLGWTRTYLKNYGAINNPRMGVWTLTAKGSATTSEVDHEKVIAGFENNRNSVQNDSEQWREELLSVLRGMSAGGFERLCQRLLRDSGFTEVTVAERTGDGGITGHGVIRLGGLISFPVMFQFQRPSSNVSAREISQFRGDMQGRSEKGLFCTTGDFTQEARREASRYGVPLIDLIDGSGLADLLIELELGVKPIRATVEGDVDANFFRSI